MKKTLIGLSVLISALLVGCGESKESKETPSKPKIPSTFEKVGETPGSHKLSEYVHKDTGCHYVVAQYIEAISIEKMYCPKEENVE